jgi:TPP-dependent 2-oxoacid decarboxylase
MDAEYNDVQEWKYKDLVPVFGGTEKNSRTYQVRTREEIEKLLDDKAFAEAGYLQVRLLSFEVKGRWLIGDSLWRFICRRMMRRLS